VARGTDLTIVLVNHDPMQHDLHVDGRGTTDRIGEGERDTLHVGVVDRPLDGWCTVGAHRQTGMVLTITLAGAAPAPTGGGHEPGAAVNAFDPMGAYAPGWKPYDPRLRPAPGGTEHRLTLEAVDKIAEVAPGVRQLMWTFGGTVPGPTLRGKVGDLFTVRLVNKGTIGHSIDFHASEVDPGTAMRTIDPGESLVYQFRAAHSGIWMYHCSTMPMLHHIGNGMYGAVVIDPPDLPKVDREYVLVQSELYFGKQNGVGDLAKMRRVAPDAVVFNGAANGYDKVPLTARVGERVRFWVLNAGPSLSGSFHVIGAQFDTVWSEGAYRLRPGPQHGGAQVLPLEAAQGGFVETVFRAPGRYPFVSHRMVDAERGAHGFVDVRR
jgi:nitrite reductase (NO-forming)